MCGVRAYSHKEVADFVVRLGKILTGVKVEQKVQIQTERSVKNIKQSLYQS